MKYFKILFFSLFFISLLTIGCGRQFVDSENQMSDEIVIKSYEDSTKMITVSYIDGDTSKIIKTYYFRNGKTYMKGMLLHGARHGEWIAYDEQGRLLTKGNYQKGFDHGLKTVFYENGNKRYEGNFKKGERIGTWQFWNEKGDLIKELTFNLEPKN